MPRVSRLVRIQRYLKALPRFLWNEYPEQVVVGCTFGTAGVVLLIYKSYMFKHTPQLPFYRGSYEVVRPNDPVALNWRTPEEYPATYLSNRENHSGGSFKKDYGWKADI